jgi:hypothetical protein
MTMATKSKSSNESSLLAAIQRKAPSAPVAVTPPTVDPVEVITKSAAPTRKAARRVEPIATSKSRVGKPVQFWLHDEDRQIVRELAAWLAGQGIRTTDTMVIRSALRMAKTGGELLEAARQASQLDGRLKQHKGA